MPGVTTDTERRGFVRRVTYALAAMLGGGMTVGLRPAEARAYETRNTDGAAGLEPWIGEIVTVPYGFAPRGFAFCEGQKMSVAQNQALFSLLGTRFGGDGRSTFGLPDTRLLEAEMKKKLRSQHPPFRYAIALSGSFPSRS